MITTFLKLEPRRRLTSIVILLAGLCSAFVIYMTAPLDDTLSWDPADSKGYLRQMESVGGKGNELATNVRLWFASLWHGERLAVTVVVLTPPHPPPPPPAPPPPPPRRGRQHGVRPSILDCPASQRCGSTSRFQRGQTGTAGAGRPPKGPDL